MVVSTMNDSPWGGSEELWSQASMRLAREGHQVRVSVAGWPEKIKKVVSLRDNGVRVGYHLSAQPHLRQRVWEKLLASKQRRHRRLRRYRPDLVLISQGHNSGGFDWARICRQAGIRYAIVVHCNCELWWFRDLDEAVESYTSAQKVFCVSENNLSLLRMQLGESLPNAEIARNPCSVTPAAGYPWPQSSGLWRLACVGRLDPAAKGQDLLLQILARPEWRNRPVELNFFGTGPYEATLRRMANILSLKNVCFRGHLSSIEDIWQQSHLLVLPSRYEGLPLALVEAMWCARPAVVTDVGDNARLCLDGRTGFVAAAPVLSVYSEALERAWSCREKWQELGLAARQHVESFMPQDPIGLFCERLKQLASAKQGKA